MQPAATDYSAFQENGEEEAHGEQKAIEVSGKFTCSEAGCGKSFHNSTNLKRHSRQHSGVKPFACAFVSCNFTSVDKSNTVRHIRHVHLKAMPLEEGREPPDPSVYLIANQEQA